MTARAIYSFECVEPQTKGYTGVDAPLQARTPEECKEIAKGTVISNSIGKSDAHSKEDNKTNIISQRDRLEKLSSLEAMAMGNDVAIGLAPRNFKGVIYAPQIATEAHKENEGYDKFSDMHWRSVWSRHGGSFDIVVDYPAPMNDCRQANSNYPVNLEYYLNFQQICCNDRGPLIYYACEDKCWHSYQGPTLMDMELALGLQGDSVIQVTITETPDEDGDTEPKCVRNGVVIKRDNQDACEVDGGTWG